MLAEYETDDDAKEDKYTSADQSRRALGFERQRKLRSVDGSRCSRCANGDEPYVPKHWIPLMHFLAGKKEQEQEQGDACRRRGSPEYPEEDDAGCGRSDPVLCEELCSLYEALSWRVCS